MGVNGLWSILGELSERKPLKHLSGKRIAVDLSGWVVQAICCKGLNTSKNPHLKNLFYRVSRLLQDGALPIFIMEGEMPAIKNDAFKLRNQHHPGKHSTDDKISRNSFNCVLSQCQDLLKSLGVPCLKSSGEAEAYCAFLCANGVVEGVITEDNDAFLYGADPVYREFTIDRHDSHVNLYSLKSKKNKLHLDRARLVALALLLGCDYNKSGIPGVGKDAALKLLSELPDCDLLQRFKDWKMKSESDLFPGYEANVKRSSHCSRCDHLGTQANHKKNGCEKCDSKITCYNSNGSNPCLCSWHKSNEISQKRKTELKIYSASKKVTDFPNSKIIEEYMCYSDTLPTHSSLEWKCPNIEVFQEKACNYWGWTADHSFKKCFPIVTSWHQYNIVSNKNCEKIFLVQPYKILTQTIVQGEVHFNVQWNYMSDTGIEHETGVNEKMCTSEYVDRFSEAYPDVTKYFFESLKQKKIKPKSPSKKLKSETSNSSSTCKKMTDFFGPVTSNKCAQEKLSSSILDICSKRCVEEEVNTENSTIKRHCH